MGVWPDPPSSYGSLWSPPKAGKILFSLNSLAPKARKKILSLSASNSGRGGGRGGRGGGGGEPPPPMVVSRSNTSLPSGKGPSAGGRDVGTALRPLSGVRPAAPRSCARFCLKMTGGGKTSVGHGQMEIADNPKGLACPRRPPARHRDSLTSPQAPYPTFEDVRDGAHKFAVAVVVLLQHNAGELLERVREAVVPEHVHEPLPPVVVVKERGIESAAADEGRRTWAHGHSTTAITVSPSQQLRWRIWGVGGP